ncbi:DNA-3-methyladenine glycosylase 2 family protein [Streptomyces sp. 8K308]|nr:AlkA N-terminal domain-containing protein [Streptomyces sp. 8K308]TDC26506.1 DNA-3-methyladenine glycosylase 2 family protein [Streptomyces sp. 8K308]
MASRDARFDGNFYVAVATTGVYCRPVCGSRTPKPENVRFFRVPAAAEAAGFRACRRCRPDAAPSSRDWNVRGDLVARALRLIAGGAVDEVGVAGVARRLAVSERHLHRQLVAEVGAGPLALAVNRRSQVARLLIESSALPMADVAFAAGYSSIRQFNDGMRAAFGCAPSQLRTVRGQPGPARPAGPLVLRLRYRPPLAAASLLAWLRARAVPGIERADHARYRRTLRLPRGTGWSELDLRAPRQHVTLRLWLEDLRDVTAAVRRCRDLLDLDADPAAIAQVLGADPLIGPLVLATPGVRVLGCVDGFELAVRALTEQHAPPPEARQLCRRLVQRYGETVAAPDGEPAALFPTAPALTDAVLGGPALTAAIRGLARAVAHGDISLDRDADRDETTARLAALPGVSPWTAQRVRRHALGDPDAFSFEDPALRGAAPPTALEERAGRWRPWRSYAVTHLVGEGHGVR